MSVRNGAGRVLAKWTLPTGAVVASKGDRQLGGCEFVLTQSTGIVVGFNEYFLRIASHVVKVLAKNIGGNLFIILPTRQYTRPIKG